MAFKLNLAGGAEVLKEIMTAEVEALADQVAGLSGPNATVSTKVGSTRFVATIAVPAAEQAKDGVLSKAASQLGLTINAYPKRNVKEKPAKTPRKRGRPRKKTTAKKSS